MLPDTVVQCGGDVTTKFASKYHCKITKLKSGTLTSGGREQLMLFVRANALNPFTVAIQFFLACLIPDLALQKLFAET